MHRWRYVIAGLLGLSCVLATGQAAPAAGPVSSGLPTRDLYPPDAWEIVVAHRAILIDVRLPQERTPGSPRGVQAEIPYALDGHADDAFVASVSRQVAGNRSAAVILICAIGPRSDAARHLLSARGYTNVTTVVNGFQGWRDFDLPRAP